MKHNQTFRASVVVLLFASALRAGDGPPKAKMVIEPDDALQSQLATFAATSARDKVERYRQAQALFTLARNDYKKVVLNMAYYAAHASVDPQHPSDSRQIFHEVQGILGINWIFVFGHLVPLRGQGDDKLDHFIDTDVIAVSTGVRGPIPALDDYAWYVRMHALDAPPAMIDQMCKRDPEKALRACPRITCTNSFDHFRGLIV